MPLIIITLLNESRAHTKLQRDRYGGKNCKNLGRFILIGDMITISGGSRGGARGTRPPYFWTKLRPEGLDRAPHLSKGLDDRPPPHPLISRSGSGAVYNVFLLLFIFRDTSSLKENINR